MPDKDLMTLGFGFDSKKAISGLGNLESQLNSVEKKYSNIKTRFEEGFNLKADTDSFEKLSTAVKSMADNSAGVRSLANSFKLINQQLPKFSPEKFAPLSPAMISSVQEFSLASNAAANSVKQIVGREFINQMALARQEMARLNAALLHVAKSGRAVREALVGIPGMLNRLSGEKVKVITPEAIESMRKYGEEVRAAASEVRSLQGFTGRIRQGSGSVSSFGSAVSGATGSIRSLGSELLNIATMTSLPMFFRNAAREATMFGAELAQIESLTLNFSADKLRQGLLALPSAFGDARKNANALYYAYSSGVEGTEKDLIDFTSQVSKLSQIIRANQVDTVNAVTTAFNAYNLSVKDAAEVSDLFYAIVKRGRAEGNELATGLGQVIPTAATAGLSLNEMGASITSLTKVMNTRNAITYFNNALSKLIKPTKESRLAAKELGIELGLDALRAKGFSAMMQELREKTLGNQQALLKIFPDLRGQRAALQLLNKGWGDFQNQLAFFEKKAGVADLAFEKLNESIEYQLSILPQTFSKVRIAAGETLTGILTLGGALEPLLRAFNNMTPAAQKAVGALTLLGAVYGLLKAKTFLFTTVQKSEIRHQQLLAALRGKEIAQRSAVTAAVNAETAAKARLAKTGFAAGMFGKKGFSGGFSSGIKGGFDVLSAAWGAGSSRSALRQIVMMRRGLAAFGKAAGSLFGLVLKIFTPLNLIIAGAASAAVFAIDFLSAKGDTFDKKLENTRVISNVAEGIYDFFSGAITEAKRIYDLIDNQKDARLLAKNMSEIGKTLTMPFSIAAGGEKGFTTQLETLKKSVERSFAVLNSDSMAKQIREYNKVQKEIEKIGVSKIFSWEEAVKEANRKFGTNVKRVSENDFRGSGYSMTAQEKKAQQEAIALYEAGSKYGELKKRAEELQAKIGPAFESGRRAGEALISFYSRNRQIFEQIGGLIEQQRFSMATPAEQMKLLQGSIKGYESDLQTALKNNNGENASRAVKNILDTYNNMLKRIDTSFKELGRFAETLAGDSFDFMLKAATTTAEKIKIFNQRASELFNESKVSFKNNALSFDTALSNADLEKSYGKLKSAIGLQIRAVQAEIDSKKKLADAERNANSNTLKLITSMDKFNSTAASAVDAFSEDALKLQSRSFAAMPAFTPATSAQTSLQGEQGKLTELYNKMAELSARFAQVVSSRQSDAQTQKETLTAALESFMAKQEQAAAQAAAKQQQEVNKLLEQGKKIEDKFTKLSETSTRIATNTNRSANALENLSVTVIG